MRWFVRNYGSPDPGICNDHKINEGESETDWKKPPPFVGEYATCNVPGGNGKHVLRTNNAMIAAERAIQLYYKFSGEKLALYMQKASLIWK